MTTRRVQGEVRKEGHGEGEGVEVCGRLVWCHSPCGEPQPILPGSLMVPVVIHRLSLVLTCIVAAITRFTRDAAS